LNPAIVFRTFLAHLVNEVLQIHCCVDCRRREHADVPMPIECYAQTIVDFVRTHESWAAPVVFAFAFGKSLAFLSLIVPGGALQLTAYAALALTYYRGELPGIALPFLFLIVLWNPVTAFVAMNAFGLNSYLNLLILAGLVLTAWFMNTLIPIASIIAACALTYACRRLGWTRVLFNDLKNKRQPKYREFFERYCDAFREVFGQRAGAGRLSTVSRDGAD
jgi:hypothetical protein